MTIATKEIALQLVSTAENGTKDWRSSYSYIEDIKDGRGYTGGIVGWCSGTDDMLELVSRYAKTTPKNSLAKYLPELYTISKAKYSKRPKLSHKLLGNSYIAAWKTAAKTPEFQKAQDSERDRVYWNPAEVAAIKDNVGPLGLYLYYDISVNHGPGDDPESFGGILAGVQKQTPSPAKNGDETAYLYALVAARDKVLKGWGDYQKDGRSTIALSFLKANNLHLTLPLHWSVYGESFSIIS